LVFISGGTGFNSESDIPLDPTLSTTPEERADNRFLRSAFMVAFRKRRTEEDKF
jgi:hypothetical protein